jgi:hypothetical protein
MFAMLANAVSNAKFKVKKFNCMHYPLNFDSIQGCEFLTL